MSYRLVEQPVRSGALGRLWADIGHRNPFPSARPRWVGARAALVGAALGGVATTVVVARPAAVPPTLLALDAAQAAPASPTLDTVATTSSTLFVPATVLEAPTTTTTVAVPGTEPLVTSTTVLPQVRVTGLGDSVLLNAKADLERRLPDARVDAEVGRQFRELLGVARAMRDAGQLGEEVILQLGNNGPVASAQFDEIMNVLRAARRVVVINVKVARPWEAPNNAMLAEGVRRWPNAVLLDWHRHGSAHPQLFADDGTHIGPTGVAMLVELILSKL